MRGKLRPSIRKLCPLDFLLFCRRPLRPCKAFLSTLAVILDREHFTPRLPCFSKPQYIRGSGGCQVASERSVEPGLGRAGKSWKTLSDRRAACARRLRRVCGHTADTPVIWLVKQCTGM